MKIGEENERSGSLCQLSSEAAWLGGWPRPFGRGCGLGFSLTIERQDLASGGLTTS